MTVGKGSMMNEAEYRFWATVAKDGSHIRDVVKATDKNMAEMLLTANYTSEFKSEILQNYDVKKVRVTVNDLE